MIREAGNHWSTPVISQEYLSSHKGIPCPDFSSCGKEQWCWGHSHGNKQFSEWTSERNSGKRGEFFLPNCRCLLLCQWVSLSTTYSQGPLKNQRQALSGSMERMGIWLVLTAGMCVTKIKQIPEESFSRCIYDVCVLFELLLENEGPSKVMQTVWIEGLILKNPDFNSQLYQWSIPSVTDFNSKTEK